MDGDQRAGAKISIRELAARTGFSVATISRVMNNSDLVSSDTRAAVLKAARHHGYRPNPAARALATKRSRIIGAIVPTLAHSIFSTFLDGIENVLADRGFSFVIALSHYDQHTEFKRAQDLLGMGAEALIVSGAEHVDDFHDLIHSFGVSCLYTSMWKEPSDGDAPMVGYDNFGLARDALTYLIGAGHNRVAVLHGPAVTNDRTRDRLRGIADAAGDRASVASFECTLDAEGGVVQTRKALACGFQPTAILCLNDVVALGSLFELPRLGLRVPDDISVMGFDNLEWTAFSNPPLTTIALPTRDMGRVAAEALADHIDDGRPLRSHRLPGRIIERGSVAPPPEDSDDI